MSKVKNLGETIDDLILTIARVAEVSTGEAVDIMISRARKFHQEITEKEE